MIVRCAVRATSGPGAPTRAALLSYYDPDAAQAGTTFLDGTEGEHPETVQAADLFAVSMLGHPIAPPAARRMLHDTPWARRIETSLRALPVQAVLDGAEPPPLQAMRALHESVLAAIDPRPDPAAQNRVTASAVCARKRPELFPVLDAALCSALLLPGPDSPVHCWQAVRAVLCTDEMVRSLAELFSSLRREWPGLVVDVYPLRQLQVLLGLRR